MRFEIWALAASPPGDIWQSHYFDRWQGNWIHREPQATVNIRIVCEREARNLSEKMTVTGITIAIILLKALYFRMQERFLDSSKLYQFLHMESQGMLPPLEMTREGVEKFFSRSGISDFPLSVIALEHRQRHLSRRSLDSFSHIIFTDAYTQALTTARDDGGRGVTGMNMVLRKGEDSLFPSGVYRPYDSTAWHS